MRPSCPPIFWLLKKANRTFDFLRMFLVVKYIREIYLHGINLMLPGILQNSNPTTIFRVGVYIDKSLIRRKSFI